MAGKIAQAAAGRRGMARRWRRRPPSREYFASTRAAIRSSNERNPQRSSTSAATGSFVRIARPFREALRARGAVAPRARSCGASAPGGPVTLWFAPADIEARSRSFIWCGVRSVDSGRDGLVPAEVQRTASCSIFALGIECRDTVPPSRVSMIVATGPTSRTVPSKPATLTVSPAWRRWRT